MSPGFKPFWITLCAALCLCAASAHAAPLDADRDAPVHFAAEQLYHDDEGQTVTAVGDVEFIQGEKILRADKTVYNLSTDTVQAIGNVSLLDADGSIHFAEYVELKKDMKEGFVHGLLSLLADDTRITAATAQRSGGTMTRLSDAAYTPCRVCETDPDPTWQIKADSIEHDAESQNLKYRNARIEVLGVPLFWTPVFTHADPSVKQRSGFLRPRYGWNDSVGTFAEGGYYFGIAPDKDATLSIRPTTRKGVLTQGEWRQRFERAKVTLGGSFAQSDRKEEDGRIESDRLRGHLEADGKIDISRTWRAGFDVARATDKNYLRLYDIDEGNLLENEVYAERFSGRDYSRISAVNVQDLRLGLRPNQPDVVPMVEHSMVGAPGSVLGGRWEARLSGVDLQRQGDGQDVQRGTARLGWQRRDIYTRTGLATTYVASVTGDAYAVQNNALAGGDNTTETRGAAYAAVTHSYPLVKRLDGYGAQAVVEPLLGASMASRVNNDPADIPDEDSVDVQIDANSLFAESRFPGDDRREGGARLNYGMKTGIYGDDGRYGKVFVGQSYRFDRNAGLFPQGSGLESHASDIVGQVSAGLGNRLGADYRIQLDNESLSARRHELQATGGTDRLRLSTRFIYLDAVAGTGFIEPREQWQAGGSYALNPNWVLSASSLMDFGAEPGLRRASVGIGYADECFSFGVEGRRNLITEASGESGTVVMLRVGLKNLGEFQSPEILLQSEPETAPAP